MLKVFLSLIMLLGVTVNVLANELRHHHDIAQEQTPHEHSEPSQQDQSDCAGKCFTHCGHWHLVAMTQQSIAFALVSLPSMSVDWPINPIDEARYHQRLWRPPAHI